MIMSLMGAHWASKCAELDAVCRPDPWRESQFIAALEQQSGQAAFVLADDNFQLNALLIEQRVLDEAELLLILVHPSRQRSGLGKRLIRGWQDAAQASGVSQFHLDVRDNNVPAILLYEGEGYVQLGKRRNYYCSPPGDALLYRRSI